MTTLPHNELTALPNNTLAVRDRVSVVFYGETQTGTVERIGPRSTLIFVRMDGSRRLLFFHPESLTRLASKGAS